MISACNGTQICPDNHKSCFDDKNVKETTEMQLHFVIYVTFYLQSKISHEISIGHI